jgi:hypothetical protein
MQTPAPRPRFKLLKRLLIFLALGTGLVVSFPFVAFAYILLQDSWEEWQRCRGYTQFTTSAWQDQQLTLEPRYVRSCMVDDLLAQGLLTNQPQAEVTALLGEPEGVGKFEGYDLAYLLGPERGLFSLDSEWLVIKLDDSGRVDSAELLID